jgi:hypothetical protein
MSESTLRGKPIEFRLSYSRLNNLLETFHFLRPADRVEVRMRDCGVSPVAVWITSASSLIMSFACFRLQCVYSGAYH